MALMALPFFVFVVLDLGFQGRRDTHRKVLEVAIRFERYGCVGVSRSIPLMATTVLVEEFLCDICTIYTNRDDELAQKTRRREGGVLL
jgi:hypothetical protein